MSLMYRVSSWLGRLSVGRKLMLIYLLDLSAVIYVSSILIHEKYLSIDFTRKEIVGTTYAAVVRDGLLGRFLPADQQPLPVAQALERLAQVRQAHDEQLQTTQASQEFADTLQALAPLSPQDGAALSRLRNQLLRDGRELLTTVSNQSNLILDPDLDSYYVMSLVALRYPVLLQTVYDTMGFLAASPLARNPQWSSDLLTLAGRLDAVAQGIESDFNQAFLAGSPQMREALTGPRQQLKATLDDFQRQIQDMANGDATGTLAQLSTHEAAVLGALTGAWNVGITELERLLHQRVDSLFARMWLHLGTALVLLGCILSLVTLVARQIARPLQQLAGVADKVRTSGDHTLRAHWNSRDEIGRLVTAFNGMLAQLDHERLLQQELAASARAAQAQRELVEAFPIPMVVTSIPEHQVLHANAPAQPWLNGRRLDPWAVGLEAGVRARFFQRLADQGVVDEFEVRWKGGAEPSWAVLSARRLQFQGQDAVLTAFTPINVLKVMEQRLELWAKVFEASSEGIIIMNAEQHIISVNKAFCRSTQYDFYEVIGESLDLLLEEREGEPLSAQISRTMVEKESWQGEVRFRRRNGETYPAWLMVSAVRPVKGEAVLNHIGIAIDITDRKLNEERIQFLAHHDVLTELPNRSLCVLRLQAALAQAQLTGEKVAVLFIDLDRFKTINDTLGHHIGDGLLRSVAGRLQQSVRSCDTVSRLGGDEFVVVMRGVTGRADVQSMVEQRLIRLIRQSHSVEGHELNVSCSVGIAVYPEDGADIEELMRRADAAMYEAKTTGRDMACFYSMETDLRGQARQTMEQQLRRAIERGELSVHYQPRVGARSAQLLGVEALLRWNSALLGSVPPSEFIPIAEETGLIRSLGAWVLEQACAQWMRWQDSTVAGGALMGVGLSVNLSAVQLADPSLAADIRAVLERTGMPEQHLELEITESQLMESAPSVADQVVALKLLGVQLSIDDFGTGYSSLAYLKRFDIDRLKIDKSFVHDMLDDPADLAITRAIISLGHSLGLKVVAEGVENRATAQMLSALACEELQGFYFSRPLPVPELERWAHAYLGSDPLWRPGTAGGTVVGGAALAE